MFNGQVLLNLNMPAAVGGKQCCMTCVDANFKYHNVHASDHARQSVMPG
jgi:hypothetical protein